MMRRAVPVVILSLSALAFAPAPLPRPERRGAGDEIDLRLFQGRWRITREERVGPGGVRRLCPRAEGDKVIGVRISDDWWTYLEPGDRYNNSFRIAVRPGRGTT